MENLVIDPSDPNFAAFASVFAHFQEDQAGDGVLDAGPAKGEIYYSDEEDEDEESRAKAAKRAQESGLTRRERRKAAVSPLQGPVSSQAALVDMLMVQKLTVAELKQMVERPEVVEWFDCDARDPRLLVSIKSYRK
jgi:splicing factor 3B subunit 2